jgi:hypothetical protein
VLYLAQLDDVHLHLSQAAAERAMENAGIRMAMH